MTIIIALTLFIVLDSLAVYMCQLWMGFSKTDVVYIMFKLCESAFVIVSLAKPDITVKRGKQKLKKN